MGKRAQRIPSWPGVIHSNKGRIHLRRPTCDILTFRLRRSGGPYIPGGRQFAGQTTRVAMPELSGMSRLRSGPSTLDAWWGRSVGPLCNFDCEHKNRRQPFRPGRLLRRFRWLAGNLGAPGKSFRAKRLYDVNAGSARRREHRSDYRRA
jgi:hypothetical protein